MYTRYTHRDPHTARATRPHTPDPTRQSTVSTDRTSRGLPRTSDLASPEAEALRGTAKRQGKWGQEMRLKSYETALSGGGSDAAGKEALRYFGLGCPPYICTSGVFGLAEGWWEAILAAEQRAIAEAEGAGPGAPDA